MKTIGQLSDEYAAGQSTLVVLPDKVLAQAIAAARYYSAYGNIASLSTPGVDLPEAPNPADLDTTPTVVDPPPIKDVDLIDENTVLSVGEWAVIRPLFVLYVERQNALMLEASRASGLEVYGRNTSEIQQDISAMENETLPAKAFTAVIITIGDIPTATEDVPYYPLGYSL